jgi:hypothetical protein
MEASAWVVLPCGPVQARWRLHAAHERPEDLLDHSVLVFLGDILVFSPDQRRTTSRTGAVLVQQRAQKLFAKRSSASSSDPV